MSASTTSIEILFDRIHPDLGPPLKFRIWFNGAKIDEFDLTTQHRTSWSGPGTEGLNHLEIEHHDRSWLNTKMAGNDIERTSMARIRQLLINRVMTNPSAGNNDATWFEPVYDQGFLDYFAKHNPGQEPPRRQRADLRIGSPGRLHVPFILPLHMGALYNMNNSVRPYNRLNY